MTPQTFELATTDGRLASAQREYDDGPGFFDHFGGELAPAQLRHTCVLDLGCGYGGRTVYYAELGTAHVTGIEITEIMVDRCRQFAARRSAENVSFQVARAEALPFEDATFDVVLSYDVFEHVDDPVLAFRELRRVLRPGGHAWLVFPTYLGMRASHLDYLTQIPALHRVFDPDMLIDVVNEFLMAAPTLGVPPQPRPVVGPLGRRALPAVNGMSRREAVSIIERCGFRVHRAKVCPFVTPAAPQPLGAVARPLERWARHRPIPDLLVGGLRFHLSVP